MVAQPLVWAYLLLGHTMSVCIHSYVRMRRRILVPLPAGSSVPDGGYLGACRRHSKPSMLSSQNRTKATT